MKTKRVKSDLILLLASSIWGTAFVAQRIGMQSFPPFLFNGIRFLLGALVLIPIIVLRENNSSLRHWSISIGNPLQRQFVILGLLLFGGASLQQVGIVFTTAGKAGFITGLYVILVPVLGILFHRKTRVATWLGAALGVTGLYYLSIKRGFSIDKGDFLVLIGAFFWTFHVLAVDRFTKYSEPLHLAFWQFVLCGLLSMATGLILEDASLQALTKTAIPILYAGILSVGVAYTLQVVGQRYAHPSHAAIILSLESPFSAIAGYLVLNETLTGRELLGAALMVGGMIISQAFAYRADEKIYA